MAGQLVNCKWLDSVRIADPGRALTIPAKCILAADRVLRSVLVEFEGDMDMQPLDDERYRLQLGVGSKDPVVEADTPWQCFIQMAELLESR